MKDRDFQNIARKLYLTQQFILKLVIYLKFCSILYYVYTHYFGFKENTLKFNVFNPLFEIVQKVRTHD